MSVIRVEALKKSFKNQPVIKGVSFTLGENRCTALVGPNGAGKTTILRMLSGLLKPSSGTITFPETSNNGDFRKFIGYLPQHPVFYEWMTGKEFLEYAGKLGGLTKEEAAVRAEELFETVGLGEAKKKRISKYSGGMRQRLGIAQAMIHRPRLLLLDEPVSALDPIGRREVLELLENLKKMSAVLFSTHILNDAEEVSDEILFLHKGEIVEAGTMARLREKYRQAKIDLTLGNVKDMELFIEQVSNKDFVQSFLVNGNAATFFVENVEEAKTVFLREILEQHLPLIKFEISKMSLEDVFMKVVRS